MKAWAVLQDFTVKLVWLGSADFLNAIDVYETEQEAIDRAAILRNSRNA